MPLLCLPLMPNVSFIFVPTTTRQLTWHSFTLNFQTLMFRQNSRDYIKLHVLSFCWASGEGKWLPHVIRLQQLFPKTFLPSTFVCPRMGVRLRIAASVYGFFICKWLRWSSYSSWSTECSPPIIWSWPFRTLTSLRQQQVWRPFLTVIFSLFQIHIFRSHHIHESIHR